MPNDRLLQTQRPILSTRCSAAPKSRRHCDAGLYSDRRLQTRSSTAPATVHTDFLGVLGCQPDQHRRDVDLDLGQHPAACRARARQHRLDGKRRQDGRAQDGHPKSADPTQDRRAPPDDVYVSIVPFGKDVNVGPQQLRSDWIAGTLGSGQRHLQQDQIHHQEPTVTRTAKIWTPANHNTWNGCVTDRDQNFDTTQQRASRRRHALSRRAICVLPGASHGPEQRLDGAERQDRHACSRSATPTRRSACSSAGRP